MFIEFYVFSASDTDVKRNSPFSFPSAEETEGDLHEIPAVPEAS